MHKTEQTVYLYSFVGVESNVHFSESKIGSVIFIIDFSYE